MVCCEVGLPDFFSQSGFVFGCPRCIGVDDGQLSDAGRWRVRYCVLPSVMIPSSLTSGAVILSTRMAVSALIRWEFPIGISGFQNAPPCQNSIPFVELVAPCSSKWCSWMSSIWGGFWREDNQVLISFCLVESLCRTPTLAKCGGEAQHLEKLGIWSPPGLPNVRSSTERGKTSHIGVFLVSLERS